MDEEAKSMWRRVREVLRAGGWVFADGLTPEQLGLLVEQVARDNRVLRFVRDYYYPKSYGGVTPILAHEAVLALVRDLEGRGPRPPRVTRVLTMTDLKCSLCGNEVEGDGRG